MHIHTQTPPHTSLFLLLLQRKKTGLVGRWHRTRGNHTGPENGSVRRLQPAGPSLGEREKGKFAFLEEGGILTSRGEWEDFTLKLGRAKKGAGRWKGETRHSVSEGGGGGKDVGKTLDGYQVGRGDLGVG